MPTSYRGERGLFEASVALGAAQLEAATATSHADRGSGGHGGARLNSTLALLESLTVEERLRNLRATACMPNDDVALAEVGGGEGGGARAGAAAATWRQDVERAVSRAAGVPFLDSAAARISRWDLHPGLQGGPSAAAARLSNRLDCAHSSLAPGAFDGEMTALMRALEGACGHSPHR